MRGTFDWEPLLLASAVFFWAGSFDILYHVQDRDFYVRRGLYSVVQRFGISAAFKYARVLDLLFVAVLVALGFSMRLGYPFFAGCLLTVGLMLYKYRIVSPKDLSYLDIVFFRINSYVSVVVFLSITLAVLVQ